MTKNTQMNIEQAMEFSLDYAKELGLEADVVAKNSRSLDISSEQKQVSEFSVNSSTALGIRLQKGKKIGVSYSESLEKESLKQMVNQALNATQISEDEPYQRIRETPESDIDGTTDEIYIEDSVEIEEKVATAIKLERELLEKDPLVKNAPYNGLSENENHLFYGNTLGTMCRQNSRSYSCFSSALLEADNKQAMHFKKSVARRFVDLDVDQCLNDIYEGARSILEGEAINSGNYDIIFHPDCLASLFAVYESVFSGKSAVLGINPWRDNLEKSIGTSELTILDSPTDSEAFPFTVFDDEGFRTQKTSLVENGVLKTFFHNSSTAEQMGVANTYSAARSPKGHLGVSGSNMRILPGKTSSMDLKNDEYLEILQMQGLGSGSNAISGDFSVGISGHVKRNGEIVKPFRGVTLSGNFFEMLKNVSLGDQSTTNSTRSFFSPSMRFHDLSVGGNS